MKYSCILWLANFLFVFFLKIFFYQVVLELQDNGNLTTSDEAPVVFGCLDAGFMQKVCLV